jgi:hypothetical protein
MAASMLPTRLAAPPLALARAAPRPTSTTVRRVSNVTRRSVVGQVEAVQLRALVVLVVGLSRVAGLPLETQQVRHPPRGRAYANTGMRALRRAVMCAALTALPAVRSGGLPPLRSSLL